MTTVWSYGTYVDKCQSFHSAGRAFDIAGTYDDQTRKALRHIQASLGIARPLADMDGWHEFLRATASADGT